MTKEDLLKYLTDCKDLELEYYNMSQEQEALQRNINLLGNPRRFSKPTKRKAEENNGVWWIIAFIVFAILGHIVTCKPIWYAWYQFNVVTDFLGDAKEWNIEVIICGPIFLIVYIILALIAALAIGGIAAGIVYLFEKPVVEQKAENEYQIVMRDYNAKVQADNDRVSLENRQKAILQSRVDQLKSMKHETLDALDKLYDVGVVYAKYRALVPIVMFCEYMESGRCSQLEGHEGAYNIYENELRQNIIISKIELVLGKLEEIKENQYMLYEAIERGNRLTNRLLDSVTDNARRLDSIESNAAVTAENSRIAANNTRIIGELEAYRLMLDK